MELSLPGNAFSTPTFKLCEETECCMFVFWRCLVEYCRLVVCRLDSCCLVEYCRLVVCWLDSCCLPDISWGGRRSYCCCQCECIEAVEFCDLDLWCCCEGGVLLPDWDRMLGLFGWCGEHLWLLLLCELLLLLFGLLLLYWLQIGLDGLLLYLKLTHK